MRPRCRRTRVVHFNVLAGVIPDQGANSLNQNHMKTYKLNREMCEWAINEARANFASKHTVSFSERDGLNFSAVCLSEYEGVKRGVVKVSAFERPDWVTVVEIAELRTSALDKMERLSGGQVEFYN